MSDTGVEYEAETLMQADQLVLAVAQPETVGESLWTTLPLRLLLAVPLPELLVHMVAEEQAELLGVPEAEPLMHTVAVVLTVALREAEAEPLWQPVEVMLPDAEPEGEAEGEPVMLALALPEPE